MNMLIISNNIYTDRGKISGAIELKDHYIKQIIDKEYLPKDLSCYEVIDVKDEIILPGFIEMHIHGFKGWNAMSSDEDELLNLSAALAKEGITSFLPTNHYGPNVFDNNRSIAKLIKEDNWPGAKALGIHMEGPFISKKRLGSVLESEVKSPNIQLMEKYIETSNNNIKTVTLAPEEDKDFELTRFLVKKGINVCLGHTDADYKIAKKAIDLGAFITQKTGNCMRGIHHREIGVLGAALLDERVYNEINSDFSHTSLEFNELVYKLKGPNKICIVSDSGVMSGMEKGEYNLPDRGKYTVGPDNLLRVYSKDPNGTIDGSIFSMRYGVKVWFEKIVQNYQDITLMSASNQARILGIDNYKGSIKEGMDADIVVLDKDFSVKYTFVEGQKVYDNTKFDSLSNANMTQYLTRKY